ncbi:MULTISPECIES: hypothetical protein [Achromobacter]|uniref:Uncharacterized protein n=1 Tax=Achromobacter aegrifaciens TaxID=1287736 RepID=A0AAD2J4M7_ACHAE|nr:MULTISPECIES: hypothetical protein [Achromobacter]CAB3921292.1 hypothetical protein LMG26684_05726 [Achromobacter mucicolens]CUJ70314.1 Uncharacterised protein [Achromobacter aegrifaciens]
MQIRPILVALTIATSAFFVSTPSRAAETSAVKVEYLAESRSPNDTTVVPRIGSLSLRAALADSGAPFAISHGSSTPYISGCEVSDNSDKPALFTSNLDSGLALTLSNPVVNTEGTSFSLRAMVTDFKAVQRAAGGAGCEIEMPVVDAWVLEEAVQVPRDGSPVTLHLGNGAKMIFSAWSA